MELALYHRLLKNVARRPNSDRRAYRRDRGAGIRLTEVMDFVRRSLLVENDSYMAPFDIRWAFGTVPHLQLLSGLVEDASGPSREKSGLSHYCRRRRGFQVNIGTQTGTCFSSMQPISKRLPQRLPFCPDICGWFSFLLRL